MIEEGKIFMFDFTEVTGHEAGIIIYTKENERPEIVVATGYGDARSENALPLLSPIGSGTIWWKEPEDAELVLEKEVEDIREEIPGAVWAVEDEESKISTDLDIVWDENADIPALFGFKAGYADPAWYTEHGYAGKVYHLTSRDDVKIIIPEFWN